MDELSGVKDKLEVCEAALKTQVAKTSDFEYHHKQMELQLQEKEKEVELLKFQCEEMKENLLDRCAEVRPGRLLSFLLYVII